MHQLKINLVLVISFFWQPLSIGQNNVMLGCEKEELNGDGYKMYEGAVPFEHKVKFFKLSDDSTFTYQQVGGGNIEVHYSAGYWSLVNDSVITLRFDLDVYFDKILNDSTLIYSGKHHTVPMLLNYKIGINEGCIYKIENREEVPQNLSEPSELDTSMFFTIEDNVFLNNHIGIIQTITSSEEGVKVCVDYGLYFGWFFINSEFNLNVGEKLKVGQIISGVDIRKKRPYLERSYILFD